jgi:esterase/lipase superfamily enzyme
MKTRLYYATNRRHRGRDQWRPTGYGPDFSELDYTDPRSGRRSRRAAAQNLRFGRVDWELDAARIERYLNADSGWGAGDGEALARYLGRPAQRRAAQITAFEEKLACDRSDREQDQRHFGSRRSFEELRRAMRGGADVLVFVHGFNVSWWEAVSSALALQLMINRRRRDGDPELLVFLFSWPSDGAAVPWFSYYSDRDDAAMSGAAVGRAFLRLRDYLFEAWRDDRSARREHCRRAFHLLCHSMGNYVLENALARTREFSRGGKPPRLFEQVLLCAPDVDDNAFEEGRGLHRLPQMAEQVTVYHNRGDAALQVSDYSKGNRDRLGWRGASTPAQLDGRVHQVDCSDIVSGVVEHGYHASGIVADDIAQSLFGLAPDAVGRRRAQLRNGWPNVWRLRADDETLRQA